MIQLKCFCKILPFRRYPMKKWQYLCNLKRSLILEISWKLIIVLTFVKQIHLYISPIIFRPENTCRRCPFCSHPFPGRTILRQPKAKRLQTRHQHIVGQRKTKRSHSECRSNRFRQKSIAIDNRLL